MVVSPWHDATNCSVAKTHKGFVPMPDRLGNAHIDLKIMFLGYSQGSVRPNFVVGSGRLKAEGSRTMVFL